MKPYVLTLLAIVGITSVGIFLVARKSVVPKGGPVIVASPPPKITPPTVPTQAPTDPAKEAARREAAAPRPEIQSPVAETPKESGPPSLGPLATGAAVVEVADNSANEPWAAEKAAIHNLVAANNPADVPAIARYLEHESAELRQAAVLGLLALGEKAGAPFLIAATVKARTPEEAESFKEAADFLNKDPKNTILPPPPSEPSNEASPADLAPGIPTPP